MEVFQAIEPAVSPVFLCYPWTKVGLGVAGGLTCQYSALRRRSSTRTETLHKDREGAILFLYKAEDGDNGYYYVLDYEKDLK